MEVYLDNAATTPLTGEVIKEIKRVAESVYGNPSSPHSIGLKAEQVIKEAREKVADRLNREIDEIYFTSGATESNNTAIFGTVYANKNRGNNIITSKIEHPSVLECFKKLEHEGFKVTYLGVNKNGIIDIDQLKSSISDDTIFVSIMTVNNELGSIQPIQEIAKLKSKYNFVFHTDAVQAFMKIPAYNFDMADIITISGHKIHALKGIGAIAIKKGIKTTPLIFGGGQERNFRSGTENVLGIASLSKAIDDTKLLTSECRDMLMNGIKDIPEVSFNFGDAKNSAAHILSVIFKGKRGEVIVHALEERGIYSSTGSACHSNRFGKSHVLEAIGLTKDEIGATIRFSFGKLTKLEDIQYTIDVLHEIIPKL